MSANATASSNVNNHGNDNLSTVVAIVALVVSAIALVGTGLQVAQQYLSSAAGYSKCDASVIGPWHTSKKRKFLLSEMRFQVLFETPVFFVCAADNTNKPIKNADIWFVDGTPSSIKETRSLPVGDPKKPKRSNADPKEALLAAPPTGNSLASSPPAKRSDGVHTADSEMSTWLRMLQEMQRMERDSSQWQDAQVEWNAPGAALQFMHHKLCVAVQAKRMSWDSMPSSISRPYATTTISHIVEMTAMLGIYWKEFDRSAGRYRAEGNGYVLTGTHIVDLGIVFTFQICGKSRFEENRIIPADETKEFAFGFVPTIFRENQDIRRLPFSTDDLHSLGPLALGSRNELAETLASFGCNTNTSNAIRDLSKNHGHLFPLAFEITGMLGLTMRIRSSLYRFLPNPTFYHWDKKYFSMRKLLLAYCTEINRLVERDPEVEPQIALLQDHAGTVTEKLLRKGEHANGAVVAQKGPEDVIDRSLMDELHDCLDMCDVFLKETGRKKVELVLREHVQELVHMVNSVGQYGSTSTYNPPDSASHSEPVRATDEHSVQPRFDDLMTAAPETRQKVLMRIYFSRLLPRVVEMVNNGILPQDDDSNSKEEVADEAPILAVASAWCTLVFRMLCWLLLHDFNKTDVQISKSELVGNRLPVFIS